MSCDERRVFRVCALCRVVAGGLRGLVRGCLCGLWCRAVVCCAVLCCAVLRCTVLRAVALTSFRHWCGVLCAARWERFPVLTDFHAQRAEADDEHAGLRHPLHCAIAQHIALAAGSSEGGAR